MLQFKSGIDNLLMNFHGHISKKKKSNYCLVVSRRLSLLPTSKHVSILYMKCGNNDVSGGYKQNMWERRLKSRNQAFTEGTEPSITMKLYSEPACCETKALSSLVCLGDILASNRLKPSS